MTIAKISNYIITVILISTLTSCYCFHKVAGKSSVRDLTVAKSFDLCKICPGRGKVVSLTPYYGYPSTDLYQLKRESTSTSSYTLNSLGTFGLRGEYWVAPGQFFPFRIIGLGIDYSYSKSSISYNYTDVYELRSTERRSHRILGSINVMTLVKKQWIGYITSQIGVNLQRTDQIAFDYFATEKNKLVDYRFGYGLQFYPKIPVGISIEAGYGGGAYLKAGLTFWLF
ncbi:MAG: hypothetical protein COA33_014870 [Fluviicola sp.]|nr:hypothetical protein [Fluviicola sp.]